MSRDRGTPQWVRNEEAKDCNTKGCCRPRAKGTGCGQPSTWVMAVGDLIPDGAKSNSTQPVDNNTVIFAPTIQIPPLTESGSFSLPTKSIADTLCHSREHLGHQQGSWDWGTSLLESLASISPQTLVAGPHHQARASPLPAAVQGSRSRAAVWSPLFLSEPHHSRLCTVLLPKRRRAPVCEGERRGKKEVPACVCVCVLRGGDGDIG